MKETWILFKTESSDAEGWEERKLLPSGNGTDLLWENWNYSGRFPAVGDRLRDYQQDSQAGPLARGRDADWVISRVELFSSFDTDQRIMVCYCLYQPIQADWQPLERGLPIDELLNQTALQ